MAKKLSYAEFKQRVFNEAFLTCLSKFHAKVLTEGTDTTGLECPVHTAQMMDKMCRAFFSDMLDLPHNTVKTTMKKLDTATTFVKDCAKLCETIADMKSAKAQEENLDVEEDQKVEMSPEDEKLIDTVFDEKNPEVEAQTVRDATVNALLAEDKKAQEIKDAIDMAKKSNDAKTMEETYNRLDRGPTSLLNAIMNNYAQTAYREVNENSAGVASMSEVMYNNKEEIRNRSLMHYAMYEMANVLGIHKYTQKEIKDIAEHIYYNK